MSISWPSGLVSIELSHLTHLRRTGKQEKRTRADQYNTGFGWWDFSQENLKQKNVQVHYERIGRSIDITSNIKYFGLLGCFLPNCRDLQLQ